MNKNILWIKQKIIDLNLYIVNKIKLCNLISMYNNYKSILIMLGLLFLLIMFNHMIKALFSLKNHDNIKIIVKTQPAITKNVAIKIYPSGNVVTPASINIYPQAEGVLLKALFKEGEIVTKDQLLFEIDPALLKSQYDQALANLDKTNATLINATLKLEKSSQLYHKKFISLQDQEQNIANFKISQANKNSAEAELNAAKIKLDYTKIYSPITGVTGEILINPGTTIKSGNQLLNIKQLNPIVVSFYISEEHLPELIKNINTLSEINIKISDSSHKGKLIFINNHVDPTTGNILVKAEFSNDDFSLWPGQFVKLELDLKTLPRVITIPNKAIQIGQDGPYVYVAKLKNQKNIAEVVRTSIETGWSDDKETVITQGIATGSLVVIEGYSTLKDHAIVEIYAHK